jgi:hypothetical protein
MDVHRRRRALVNCSVGWTVCLAFLVFSAAPAWGQRPEESTCTRAAGKFKPGKAVNPPITLTADPPTQTVNFGGDRGWKFADVVLKASRPLPPRVRVAQLDLEVLRRLSRQGETTTTIATKPMKFTEPRLNPRRDVITFTICLDGAGLEAGRYQGAMSVEGPSGVGPTNLAINANVKNEGLFIVTVIITGVLVFVLLLWRGATTEQKDQAKVVAEEVKDTPAGTAVSAETKDMAAKATGDMARVKLSANVLLNPIFWLTTAASAALALGAALTIYSQNTGWGADGVADAFAVATAVLAAAGFRSLLLTTAGK